MKRLVLILLAAALASAATAQSTPSSQTTPSAPAASSPSQSTSSSAKTASSTASAAKTASPATATAKPVANVPPPWIKLPAGVPRVAHGPLQTPLSLHYEDIKPGAGALGESGKLWHIKYTGWRAADGIKFDSWDDHKQPVMGKDGKPVLGPDGKPQMGDPQPMAFPQGQGRVIPGFDYGLAGMKIGGKRRIFIPWEMAYGTRNIPDRPDHPGIPAKSDLIFDVELVDVTDMPAPQMRPGMPGAHPVPIPQHPGAGNQPGAAPANPPAPGTPAPGAASAPPTHPAQPAAAAPAAQPANPQSSAPSAQPATQPQPSTQPPPK